MAFLSKRWYWNTREGCNNFWKFPDATFFAFSLASTVGYGHVTTETNTGKIFVMIYGIIGIPIFFVLLDILV